MKNINTLYYQFLHIEEKNAQDIQKSIATIVNKNIQTITPLNISLDGLCKVIAHNIAIDLDKNHISYSLLNTKKQFGLYEHECLIAYYLEKEEFQYILIDPTYSQFKAKKGEMLISSLLADFPNTLLCKTEEGKGLSHNLIQYGYSPITDQLFKQYINSFSEGGSIDISLDELMSRKYK